jgi:NTE family protein
VTSTPRPRTDLPIRAPSVAIACQGGGSHTAFTAGVLAHLLVAPELADRRVTGISGTSGGAVCATLAWTALRRGDRAAASRLLTDFWRDNAADGPLERVLNAWLLLAASLQSYGLVPEISPYHTPVSNVGLEEFRAMLERHVDFDAVTVDDAGEHPQLLLGAVDVQSGAFRAFNSRRDRITADCVLASAAIPTLFRAVSVDGASYWDGLFSQNPPVRELLDTRPDELWVVQVNPRARAEVPQALLDIEDRRNELSGNLSLYQELAFIEKIDELLAQGVIVGDRYKQVMVRVIELPADQLRRVRGPASKLNREPEFLDALIELGRTQAEHFLRALAFERAWARGDADELGRSIEPRATVDVDPALGLDRMHAAELLAGPVRIDHTHKQVSGDGVSWSVRVDGVGDRRALADVTFGPTRVSAVTVRATDRTFSAARS